LQEAGNSVESSSFSSGQLNISPPFGGLRRSVPAGQQERRAYLA